jgi:hypothetical protein
MKSFLDKLNVNSFDVKLKYNKLPLNEFVDSLVGLMYVSNYSVYKTIRKYRNQILANKETINNFLLKFKRVDFEIEISQQFNENYFYGKESFETVTTFNITYNKLNFTMYYGLISIKIPYRYYGINVI